MIDKNQLLSLGWSQAVVDEIARVAELISGASLPNDEPVPTLDMNRRPTSLGQINFSHSAQADATVYFPGRVSQSS